MMLKLKRTLLLSGLGLIAFGAITPVIASCSKKAKADAPQEPIYDAVVVQSLFEQFIENYQALVSGTEHEAAAESEIARFEAEYEAYENDKADLPDADKYALCAKWVKDKAALYDIVLVEWTNVDKNREAMMESTLVQNQYSENVLYAIATQNDLVDQGIDENKSFNEYVDTMEEYDERKNSATLFPRSHGYTLRATSRVVNREFNAIAAKANLLSQTIDTYLELNDNTNILTYLSTTTETSPFETDGILKYDSSGRELDFSKTTTQIVGEDGNYLDASGSAYRLLTKDAAKDLFNYSYLDLDAGEDARTVKPFDGTKIFDNDTYEVSIALHVKSSDPSLEDSEQLLSYENYSSMMFTFEYNIVVTNVKDGGTFSVINPVNGQRYPDTDEAHKISYFSLVGAKTYNAPIPAEVTNEHGADYLTETLGYDAASVRTIVDAFGVVFADIKKDERGADGRPTEASNLVVDEMDNDIIKSFYFLTTANEKNNGLISFTEKYGSTNGNLASTKGKWLSANDANYAVHLQVKFIESFISSFGIEYFDNNKVDVDSLTITEANKFLDDVLGAGVLQIAVKIEDTGVEQDKDELVGSYVELGVYLTKPDADEENKYEVIAPLAAQNNDSHYGSVRLDSQTTADSFKQYVDSKNRANEAYNTLYFPLFTSADQAKNYDYCNKLLAQENLIIHEKIMKFVSVDSVEKFVGHLDNLLTTNTVYFALNISMVVLYGLKAIFDAFTLACSWAFPPTAIQAAIQLAGDILSIIFISLEIYNSNKTIKKLEPMLAIFEKYLEKSKDPTQGYTQIRVAYEAYMNKLWIYKDTTREALERAEAAASVAETGGLYDVFMQLLTSNLFDFVNQSIELALGMDSKFDGDGFSWGVFKGMSGLGPFLASLIYNIIALLIVFVFVRVAGVVIKAASFAVVTVTDRLAANTLTKFENIALDIGNKVINETANLAEVTEVLINVRPLMKISGIAGAILAVMDILFTVGYSIMVSAIANSVNDMVSGFDKNSK